MRLRDRQEPRGDIGDFRVLHASPTLACKSVGISKRDAGAGNGQSDICLARAPAALLHRSSPYDADSPSRRDDNPRHHANGDEKDNIKRLQVRFWSEWVWHGFNPRAQSSFLTAMCAEPSQRNSFTAMPHANSAAPMGSTSSTEESFIRRIFPASMARSVARYTTEPKCTAACSTTSGSYFFTVIPPRRSALWLIGAQRRLHILRVCVAAGHVSHTTGLNLVR